MSDVSALNGSHWPVVVVGGGPAGLTSAITLARAGVRCLVIDRRRDRSAQPRATSVSLSTMELFRSWGIEELIRAGGDDVVWKLLLTSTLAESATGQAIDVGYPTDDQSALLSPTSPACVPQDHLETVLFEHLQTLPSAQVVVESLVEAVAQDSEVCWLQVRDLASDATVKLTAEYVIGADGAHGMTRADVGIARWTSGRLLEAVSVMFRAPIWELVGEHRYGIYSVDTPDALGSFLPAGRGDRWVYSFSWDPQVQQLSDYPDDVLIRLIRAGAGEQELPVRIESVGAFAFVASLAERFRAGRVYLVGDAAHQVTPRGGTGMNTAIADGYDLGWKLAWVLAGWADESLLDSYERERRPVAEHNLVRSIDPEGSRRAAANELGIDLGGRLRHVWLPDAATSTLDLLGPGLTLLISDPTPTASDPTPTASNRTALYDARTENSAPVIRHVLDPVTAHALGIRSGHSMLLRPDGLLWPSAVSSSAVRSSTHGAGRPSMRASRREACSKTPTAHVSRSGAP